MIIILLMELEIPLKRLVVQIGRESKSKKSDETQIRDCLNQPRDFHSSIVLPFLLPFPITTTSLLLKTHLIMAGF